MSLEIKNISVSVEGKLIIEDLSLCIQKGEIHAIMGPNGSGKSTLSNALAGHPKYTIQKGEIMLDDEDLVPKKVDERARMGLFLSMQYSPEIPGVSITNFLRTAVSSLQGVKQHPVQFHKNLLSCMKDFGIEKNFANRYLNVGFSGGEKKKLEILQLAMMNPKYAILDETDSGLDVDALKIVCAGINNFATQEKGLLLITHYNRILEYVEPNFVHILIDGKIVETGDKSLAVEIEKNGYKKYL